MLLTKDIPQAERLDLVVQLVRLDGQVPKGDLSYRGVLAEYRHAARMLGWFDSRQRRTPSGLALCSAPQERQGRLMAEAFACTEVARTWLNWSGAKRLTELSEGSALLFLETSIGDDVGLRTLMTGSRTLESWLQAVRPFASLEVESSFGQTRHASVPTEARASTDLASLSKTPGLSKSRFVTGLQCLKRLWLSVHEPEAEELVPDSAQQAVFDKGHVVGELARKRFAGGVLIERSEKGSRGMLRATQAALHDGSPAIFEASFAEDSVFVSVDVLEQVRGGFDLTEVKATTKVKEQHVPDVAVQLYVLRKAGVVVKKAEIMHLNGACRAPDLSDLFTRVNVTKEAEALQEQIPRQLAEMQRVLAGPIPKVEVGAHCDEPYPCPFAERCHPPTPEHHVSTLYRLSQGRLEQLIEEGYSTIRELPDDLDFNAVTARQIRAVKSGRLTVDPELRGALAQVREPVAFLDFETVNPAVPVWNGTGPYQPVPVQVSCHVRRAGTLQHFAWLASRGEDPRPGLARAVVNACAGAKTILAYNASFEKRLLRQLAEVLPTLKSALLEVEARVQDLLELVRDHVYHPDFGGSFSLKSVGPALVSGLSYDDLEVQEGGTASMLLESYLLGPEISDEEEAELRPKLLAYCERDTLATVRVFEALCEMG